MLQQLEPRKNFITSQINLTTIRKQLLIYIAGGLSNKDIAVLMDTEEQTVKNSISQMLELLHCKNRAEIATVAIFSNFITLEEVEGYLGK